MEAFKVFFLLALTSFASFLICSSYSSDDKAFGIGNFDRVNQFFSVFVPSVAEKLHQLCLQLAQVEELESICPSILSFPILAGDQLFNELMINLHDLNDDDHIYESFLVFFNHTIGFELDQIKLELNSFDEYDFDPYIKKISSDLKDAIISSVKVALIPFRSPGIQRTIPKSSFKAIAEMEDDDFDEISVESLNCATNHFDVEDEDIVMMISSRSDSPIPSPELAYEAMSILFYDIRANHELFPIVKSYLQFIRENSLKICNPNSLFPKHNAQSAFNHKFDSRNLAFQEFCNYVRCFSVPITSPLYQGPFVSKSKIAEARRIVLTSLAIEKMRLIIETFDYNEMTDYILSQCPEIEPEILECFINHMREEASNFLLTIITKISLVSGLKETIETAYQHISNIFCLSFEPKFSKTIVQTFLSIFDSPLALIKRYDSLEDWKSYYDETSPTYKPRISSPEEESKSLSRKSVKIVEANNEICLIKSISDIEREFVEKDNVYPIRRSGTKTLNLNELIEIEPYDRSSSPLAIFEDSTRVFKIISPIPVSSKIKLTNEELSERIETSVNRFSSSEVPDFPFQDSSEIIRYPEYIKDTGDYFLEHGDNSCFMLDERIYSIEEGIREFLSESFKEKKTVDSVMKIFENSLSSIFKS